MPTGDTPLGGTNHRNSFGRAEPGGDSRGDGDSPSERTISALTKLVRLLARQVAAEGRQAVASDHSKAPAMEEIER